MRLRSRFIAVLALIAAPALAQTDGPPIPPGTDPRYVSQDKVEFDEVGRAGRGENIAGVTGATSRLPANSFAEVTDLASGRTILVRIVPSTLDGLIRLSDEALAQLGASGVNPDVRVRRINPPQFERTALEGGGKAAERLATPPALLNALRKKLAGSPPVAGDPAAMPKAPATPAAKPMPKAPPPADSGRFFVQIAALSGEASAKALAAKIDGNVQPSGKFWRVRAGPFATEAEARSALGGLRAKGYRDARITR